MQADDFRPQTDGIVDILLVEDEAILAMVAGEVLGDAGYRVRECGSAEEALKAIDGGYCPHLAIIDHGLPGMSGADLAGAMAGRLVGVAILIASGNSDSAGFGFPVLSKPYRDADLVDCVAGLLADLALQQRIDRSTAPGGQDDRTIS